MNNGKPIQAHISKKSASDIRSLIPAGYWGSFAGYLIDKYISDDEIEDFKSQWDFKHD